MRFASSTTSSSSRSKTLSRDSRKSTTPPPQNTLAVLESTSMNLDLGMQLDLGTSSLSPTAMEDDLDAYFANNIDNFVNWGEVGPVEQAVAEDRAPQLRPEDIIPESEIMAWSINPPSPEANDESKDQEGSRGQGSSLAIPIPLPRNLPTTLFEMAMNDSQHPIPTKPFTQAEANRVFEFWANNVWSDTDITGAFNFYCAGTRIGIHNPPDFISEVIPFRTEADISWALDQVTWRTDFAKAFAAAEAFNATSLEHPAIESPQPATPCPARRIAESPQTCAKGKARGKKKDETATSAKGKKRSKKEDGTTPAVASSPTTTVPAHPTTEPSQTSAKDKKHNKKENGTAITVASSPTPNKRAEATPHKRVAPRKRKSTNNTEDPASTTMPAPRKQFTRLSAVPFPTPAPSPAVSSPDADVKPEGTPSKRVDRSCIKPPNEKRGGYSDEERAYLGQLVLDDPGAAHSLLAERYNAHFPNAQRTVKSLTGRVHDWKELKPLRQAHLQKMVEENKLSQGSKEALKET
ncbi:uncharacterized protein BDZ99DRAFT_517846 [Mytilinidion resinicola]|uniref:Uncharacterized protein n=1 Tax=Mytilinidion resinicola TaxID=574789 RepID=A0A6A6Z050_9PEZI|nr:uncharacterized protein BDZ99DRAFT_517846 [Mytilinidion resinicola]KAF2813597.1 hypothetical protein BDZ99DRAFT_517846 [Mytilinidion resinicola]